MTRTSKLFFYASRRLPYFCGTITAFIIKKTLKISTSNFPHLFSALFFILKKYYLTISYLLVGICQNGVSHALNKWRIEIKRWKFWIPVLKMIWNQHPQGRLRRRRRVLRRSYLSLRPCKRVEDPRSLVHTSSNDKVRRRRTSSSIRTESFIG